MGGGHSRKRDEEPAQVVAPAVMNEDETANAQAEEEEKRKRRGRSSTLLTQDQDPAFIRRNALLGG